MGGCIFLSLTQKFWKFSGILGEALVVFGLLLGQFLYILWRFGIIFSHQWIYLVVGSFILAGIGTLMDFCYLAKNRILHGIGSVFLRLLVLLSISTATLILEQVLHPNIRIPGTAIILFIFAVTIGGFIRDKRLISTHLILKNAKLKTDHTVVFVSDLHADLIHSQRYLRKLVNKILMEQPDLVLIGGDLINIPHERYISYFEEFQRIKVPVYAVIGNHDIYFGPDTTIIEKIFKVWNIIPLRNTSTQWEGLQLVGIDDKELRGKKKLPAILAECQMKDTGEYTIFLTHRPIRLSKVAQTPIDLELAGHTHKGQIRGLHFLSQLVNDYTYGKYLRKDKTAFVSQGTGTRTPFRIGTEGEIVVLHLQAK